MRPALSEDTALELHYGVASRGRAAGSSRFEPPVTESRFRLLSLCWLDWCQIIETANWQARVANSAIVARARALRLATIFSVGPAASDHYNN